MNKPPLRKILVTALVPNGVKDFEPHRRICNPSLKSLLPSPYNLFDRNKFFYQHFNHVQPNRINFPTHFYFKLAPPPPSISPSFAFISSKFENKTRCEFSTSRKKPKYSRLANKSNGKDKRRWKLLKSSSFFSLSQYTRKLWIVLTSFIRTHYELRIRS